jgi:tetraacyldisaccharide 4'-kinase
VSPLSLIYRTATEIRNRLYDSGVLKARCLSQPVISVGNISSGGAGKTPFVILLGELLKTRNISFDILSRGYGRRTRGVLAVDPNGSADQFGDEPLLIAQRLGCPVVVGEDRYEAGKFAEQKLGPRWHILDDGFQHRSLARDFDIVMLTPPDIDDHLLPSGRLREQLTSLRRSDVVVLSGDFKEEDFSPTGKTLWRVRRGTSISNPPESPIVFCGIARPNAFLEQLRACGVREVGTKFYRDHHRYSERDVSDLTALSGKNRAGGFITTEKDEINLGPLALRLSNLAVARVTMELDQPDAALDTLLRVVGERRART